MGTTMVGIGCSTALGTTTDGMGGSVTCGTVGRVTAGIGGSMVTVSVGRAGRPATVAGVAATGVVSARWRAPWLPARSVHAMIMAKKLVVEAMPSS